MRLFFLLALYVAIMCTDTRATTYYVAPNGTACDKCVAAGPCESNDKCMNMQMYNQATFNPGDCVVFCEGIYRDQVTISSGGQEENPVTYMGQGEVIIDGSKVEANWDFDGGEYYASGYTRDPNQVFEDGVRLNKVTSQCPGGLQPGEWCYQENFKKVYIRTNDDQDPSGHLMEISERDVNIYANGIDHVVIDNFVCEKSRLRGIFGINGSQNWVIKNTKVSNAFLHNIQFGGEPDSNGIVVENCEVSYAGQTGLNVCSSDWEIRNCEIHHNAAITQSSGAGIHTYGSKGIEKILIENNHFYSNGPENLDGYTTGAAIWIDGAGDVEGYQLLGTVIRYNIINGDKCCGIILEDTENAEVYHNIICNIKRIPGNWRYGGGIVLMTDDHDNLVYNNTIQETSFGIIVRGDGSNDNMTGNIIKNNIASNYEYRFLDARSGGENDGVKGSDNLYINNYFGPEKSNFIQWGAGIYFGNYNDWYNATGCEDNKCNNTVYGGK